jgi:hypothetical protein
MFLQSVDSFDTIVRFNPEIGSRSNYSKATKPVLQKPITAGLCGEVDGHFLALYVRNANLYVLMDGKGVLVDDEVNAQFLETDGLNTLLIQRHGSTALRLDYRPIEPDPPLSDDPTPFLEAEDFDFPLLLYNIISQPQRRIAFRSAHRG